MPPSTQGGRSSSGKSPSLINRVFDILQRGQYASAEGVRKVLEPGGGSGLHDILNFTTGAQEGLLGKKKTSFTDVLKEHGVKGWQASIGGLAGDIFLDPTTYLTLGATKAGEAAAAKTLGGRALAETYKAAKTGGELSPILKSVGNKAVADAVSTGEKISKRQMKNIFTDAVSKEAGSITESAARTPGSINVKFMGQQIGSSQKAYNIASAIGRGAASTKLGGGLNKAVRTAASFPGKTNVFRRAETHAGYSWLKDTMDSIDKAVAGASKSDLRSLSHLTEKGVVGGLGEHGADLGEMQKFGQALQDSWYAEEKKIGLHPADDSKYVEDYIHHTYQKGSREAQQAFKRSRFRSIGSDTPGFTKTKVFKTLEDAQKAGLDPIEDYADILKIRAAKHNAIMTHKRIVDAHVLEYGVELKNAAAKKLIREQGLRKVKGVSKFIPKNMYFPETVANSLELIDKVMTDPQMATGLGALFDAGQRQWKFIATAANPGYHVRNLVGDMWMNRLNGLKDPRRYAQSAKLLSPNEVTDSSKLTFKVGEGRLNGEELLRLFKTSGASSDFNISELGRVKPSTNALISKVQSGKQKIMDWSGKREEFSRLANFIHSFEEEARHIKGPVNVADKAVKDAAARAAQRTRKFGIDYGDLTYVEQRYLRRAIPFYTFARKNIPLQIEAMLTQPGLIAKVPKGIRAIETLLGQDSRGIGGLATVPDFIKEMAPIQLGEDTFMTPPLPFYEAAKYGTGDKEDIFRNLLNQFSPAIKIPIEQATGESLFSGAPNPGMLEYILNQIPSGRVAGKLVGGEPGKLLNYLTGAGIQGVTPSMKRGAVIQTRKEQKEARKR